jgi:hypothetical protein
MYLTHIAAALANSSVRTLSQQEELPLLRDHLLRLDRNSSQSSVDPIPAFCRAIDT